MSRTDGSTRALLVAGALTGLVALGITAVYHVPRNNALDRIDAGSASAADAWQGYAPGWVAMNGVRAGMTKVEKPTKTPPRTPVPRAVARAAVRIRVVSMGP